jgi:hypothetical protein
MDLNTLFQSDPAAQELGLRQIADERAHNKATLEQLMQSMQQKGQMFPEELRARQLGNQATEAQLPGLQAQSSLSQDKASLSRNTMAQQLEEAFAKHKGNMSDAQVKELTNAGQRYGQVGAMLGAIPGPARASAAKQLLGDLYRPEFDQYNPNDLADTVSTLGQWMTETGSKFQLQSQKSDTARALEAEKTRRALELQQMKNASNERLGQLRADALKTKDPKKFEELAVRHKMAAEQASSPEEVQKHMEQAAMALEAAKMLRPMDPTKPQLSPDVAPGVLVAPPGRENPLAPNAAKPDPLGIR